MAADTETRAANFLDGERTSTSLIRGPCVQKWQTSARLRGSPPKALFSMRDNSLPSRHPESERKESAARKPL